ncbi:MAG: hypothetical protein KJ697_04635 [Nanoarchaeota archaeon]|nr:hypothetical protein [Nanoarchaeota archaeon]
MNFKDDIKVLQKSLTRIQKNMPNFKKMANMYFKNPDNKNLIEFIAENKQHFIGMRDSNSKRIIKNWRKIEKRYFSEVEKITCYKWKFKTYECYLSSTFFIGGNYTVDEKHLKPHNTIMVCPYTKHVDPIYVIAHELFHAHTQGVISCTNIKLDKNYLKISGPMAEIILKVVFSEIPITGFNRNVYPQYDKICQTLKKRWIKDKDFKKLILDTYDLLEKGA